MITTLNKDNASLAQDLPRCVAFMTGVTQLGYSGAESSDMTTNSLTRAS